MAETDGWVEEHNAELRDLADRLGADPDSVRIVAGLVVAGATDDEIYDLLRATTPVWNGQQNPLAGAADLVAELRAMVDTPR